MIAKFLYSPFQIQRLFLEKIPTDTLTSEFFQTITNSSLECQKGSLFVPLVDKRDGHEFIPDALSRGATGFLFQKGNPIWNELSPKERSKAILVSDTFKALGELALMHRLRFQPLTIGITGSSGKTTTKELFRSAFSFLPSKEVLVTEKNYNNEIGVPFTLFGMNDKTKVAILEIGMNHSGEIDRITRWARPDISVITTLGSAHIENLGSPEGIAHAKLEILTGMKPGSKLYVPEDCNFIDLVQKKCEEASVQLRIWNLTSSQYWKVKNETKDGFEIQTPTKTIFWNSPGRRILGNLFGVVHVMEDLQLEKTCRTKILSQFQSPDKRLEAIPLNQAILLNDCYNANPESMVSSIEASLQIAENSGVTLLLGDMKELGQFSEVYHRKCGEVASHPGITQLVCFGKDSHWIGDEWERQTQKTAIYYKDTEEDWHRIQKESHQWIPTKGVLLLKGSRSMKMERFLEILLPNHSNFPQSTYGD